MSLNLGKQKDYSGVRLGREKRGGARSSLPKQLGISRYKANKATRSRSTANLPTSTGRYLEVDVVFDRLYCNIKSTMVHYLVA